MHYQTSLEAIDEHGSFFGAIYFSNSPVGGDDTRETAFAHFSTGHLDKLEALVDLGPACTLPRPASLADQAGHNDEAASQYGLANDASHGRALRDEYAKNAARMLHRARLAADDTVWVPRHVLANQSGLCLLGFDINSPSWTEPPRAHLRLVDLRRGSVLLNETSVQPLPEPDLTELRHLLRTIEETEPSRLTADDRLHADELRELLAELEREAAQRRQEHSAPRHGLLPRELAAPCALSADGSSALFLHHAPGDVRLQERALRPDLAEIASISIEGELRRAIGVTEGWLVISDKSVCLYSYGDCALRIRRDLPTSASAWGAKATRNGRLIALPGDACFLTLDLDTGTVRQFHPHHGVRHDASVAVSISECGDWIASTAEERLFITKVSSGVSYEAGEIRAAHVEAKSYDDFVVRSRVYPAMAFVGGRLLVADENGLRELIVQEN